MVPAAEMDAHMIQGKPGITFTFPVSVAPDQRIFPVIHNIAHSLYRYTVQLTSVGKISLPYIWYLYWYMDITII